MLHDRRDIVNKTCLIGVRKYFKQIFNKIIDQKITNSTTKRITNFRTRLKVFVQIYHSYLFSDSQNISQEILCYEEIFGRLLITNYILNMQEITV